MKRVYRLVHSTARQRAIQDVQGAPEGFVVTVSEPTRSLDQNARLHAMLHDISQQSEYMGKRRTIEFWKGLFVSGWQIATNQKPEIVPGLEGEFINIRISTTSLGVRALGSVMEYVSAWAASNGVRFTEEAYS